MSWPLYPPFTSAVTRLLIRGLDRRAISHQIRFLIGEQGPEPEPVLLEDLRVRPDSE